MKPPLVRVMALIVKPLNCDNRKLEEKAAGGDVHVRAIKAQRRKGGPASIAIFTPHPMAKPVS